jgi:hypothetical protein
MCESRALPQHCSLLDYADMTASDVAPGTKDTFSTSLKTEESLHETPEHSIRTFVPGHEESEHKKEEILETLEDNWETDPENARNWPTYKKWVSMLIVRWIMIYVYLPTTSYGLRFRSIHLCHP